MSLSRLGSLIKSFKILRGVFLVILFMAILIPVIAYVVLSSDWASNMIRERGQQELSALLGTEVTIGEVDFSPFNALTISGVAVKDDNDSTALTIKEIGTRFEFFDLLWRQKIIVDYATVSGLNVKLYRDTVGAPLNIEKIVRRLAKDDTENAASAYSLRLNDIRFIDCNLSYDVFSEPETPGRFNTSHIRVSDMSLTAFAPVVANDHYRIRLHSMNLCEQSGLCLSDLSVKAELTDSALNVRDLKFEMPNSALTFADITLPIDSIQAIPRAVEADTLKILLDDDSHIYLPDLKAFVPAFDNLDYKIMLGMDADLSQGSIVLRSLNLSDLEGLFTLNAQGTVNDYSDPREINFEDIKFSLTTDSVAIKDALNGVGVNLSPHLRSLLYGLGRISVNGTADGALSDGTFNVKANSRIANLRFDGHVRHNPGTELFIVNGKVKVDSMRLNRLSGNPDFGKVTAALDIRGSITPRTFIGDLKADIQRFDFKGYPYRDIAAVVKVSPTELSGTLNTNDPNAMIAFTGSVKGTKDSVYVYSDLNVRSLRPDTLNLCKKYPGYNLSGHLAVQGEGLSIDRFRGTVDLDRLEYIDRSGQGLRIDNLYISADNMTSTGRIVIDSDFINGTLDGDYTPSTIKSDMMNMYRHLLPTLSGYNPQDDDESETNGNQGINDFVLNLNLTDCNRLFRFFNLPVYPVEESEIVINSSFNSEDEYFYLKVDAPWLDTGNSFIQNTSLTVNVNGSNYENGQNYVYLNSYIPTKKGDMDLDLNVGIDDGKLDTQINWMLDREKNISGIIAFDTSFIRDDDDDLVIRVGFKPGSINFGNEIWNISESDLTYGHNQIIVNNLRLDTYNQSLHIDGVASERESDLLTVSLDNIELINIFDTLDIDAALIGGLATGVIEGRGLLSKSPEIKCDALDVKSIGYNYCTIGDATVALSLDDGGKIFNFDADVRQPGGHLSKISGFIVPATEEIEINIDADHVPVGFMKPFMSAFTSDVYGYGTGKARLFGTFKDIDLTGDILAEDVYIKIDFTNTWYHTTDRLVLEPGYIRLNNVALIDKYGKKAILNGYVSHEYFHNAKFNFKITDADNFLCYDVKESPDQNWYGTIFGNGTASVVGEPGVVNISAEMETAKGTKFTFIISDREDADEYSFITFRDMTPKQVPDSILHRVTTPTRVLESKNKTNQDEAPTAYNMKIAVMITPVAELTVVMDPIGGDKIVAYGEGSIQMLYGSRDNDLKLRGTYSIQSGSYNFTLQDIIRKDFTIRSGKIQFNGNPYAAYLDNVEAFYETKGNLSDLDESFLQDRDINNTLVRVHAVMNVSGDIRQIEKPKFKLEFPTLNQDVERKVNSILSAEDMISQQIFYLLALGKFYTPEYMASATKGNELFAVASSTLSSQLSNVLGKLSDNWSIAPNLRSNRGDFSDFEFDVALRSSLLNNRLILNGNFGYRDKSLNTNQFIGDFDAEYLLTRSGDWRLKAYNRYNDQNYYLRSAATTQGIGLVYRKDFDKTLRFIDRLFKRNNNTASDSDTLNISVSDTIEVIQPDTIRALSPDTTNINIPTDSADRK